MKIKLDPTLAYLIGLWKSRRSKEGVGVRGGEHLQGIFASLAMERLKIPPERLLIRDESAFFYHSAYRSFFQKTVSEQLERFGKRNDYSAAYLAGIFDGCGGVEKGAPYFARMSAEERMLIERLGFMTKKWRGRTYVSKREDFFSFVKPWLRHPVTKQNLTNVK